MRRYLYRSLRTFDLRRSFPIGGGTYERRLRNEERRLSTTVSTNSTTRRGTLRKVKRIDYDTISQRRRQRRRNEMIERSNRNDDEMTKIRCKDRKGLNVAMIGSPNAGKSLLVNRLIDTKVTAVSPKVNTTRTSIHGVKTNTKTNTQYVFVDLPGFVEKRANNKGTFVSPLRHTVESALINDDLEAIMLVVDATTPPDRIEWAMVDRLATVLSQSDRSSSLPCFLVLNKMDKIRGTSRRAMRAKAQFDELLETLQRKASDAFEREHILENNQDETKSNAFDAIVQTSALKRWGLHELERALATKAVKRDWEYDAEDVTSLTIEDRITEIVRSHFFRRLNNEVPYKSSLSFLELQEREEDDSILVRQQIAVRSKSHMRIVRGAVAYIERAAKQDLQATFKRRVELYISVKRATS